MAEEKGGRETCDSKDAGSEILAPEIMSRGKTRQDLPTSTPAEICPRNYFGIVGCVFDLSSAAGCFRPDWRVDTDTMSLGRTTISFLEASAEMLTLRRL